MNISVIIAAGGSSTRYGKDKLIEKINNEEVIIHTLKKFYNILNINEIVIVTAKHLIEIVQIITHFPLTFWIHTCKMVSVYVRCPSVVWGNAFHDNRRFSRVFAFLRPYAAFCL